MFQETQLLYWKQLQCPGQIAVEWAKLAWIQQLKVEDRHHRCQIGLLAVEDPNVQQVLAVELIEELAHQ